MLKIELGLHCIGARVTAYRGMGRHEKRATPGAAEPSLLLLVGRLGLDEGEEHAEVDRDAGRVEQIAHRCLACVCACVRARTCGARMLIEVWRLIVPHDDPVKEADTHLACVRRGT